MADALCALSVREYQCGRLPRNNREPRHAVANAQRRSDRMDRSAGCGVHQTSAPDLQTRCCVPHLEPEERHAAVLPRARSRFGLSATSGLKTFIPIFIPCQPLGYCAPYLTEIRSGQIRGTDSCFVCNPLVLNSPTRRHLHRKIIELACKFSSVNRRVAGSSPPREAGSLR